ncbi:hypothetical protein BJX68DRAFT_227273 [Aspergillus pseudodeflectus]|uniref:Uncharacterized protein n=1 Tax=Aspergillus pseudodeflectus TaxID=176178 RepID=A0ABR4L2Q7_9EURO
MESEFGHAISPLIYTPLVSRFSRFIAGRQGGSTDTYNGLQALLNDPVIVVTAARGAFGG